MSIPYAMPGDLQKIRPAADPPAQRHPQPRQFVRPQKGVLEGLRRPPGLELSDPKPSRR